MDQKLVNVESLKAVNHAAAVEADRRMFADANAQIADPKGVLSINLGTVSPGTVVKKIIPVNPSDNKSPLRDIYICALPDSIKEYEKDLYRIKIELPQKIHQAGLLKPRMEKELSEYDYVAATSSGKSLKATEADIKKFKEQLAAMPENNKQQTAGNIEAMNRFKSELMAIAVKVDGKISEIETNAAKFAEQIKEQANKFLNDGSEPIKKVKK